MSNYTEAGALSQSSQMCIGELVREQLCELKLKYFHDLDYSYVDTPCYYRTNGDVLSVQNNNILVYNIPVYKTEMNLLIYDCSECGGSEINYSINLNEPIDLGYCPKYVRAANKIIRWIKKFKN